MEAQKTWKLAVYLRRIIGAPLVIISVALAALTIDDVTEYNAELGLLANTLDSRGQNPSISIVDHHSDFNDGDLADGIHPNRDGDRKMAWRWMFQRPGGVIGSLERGVVRIRQRAEHGGNNSILRILCLGDSITYGNYRFDFWRHTRESTEFRSALEEAVGNTSGNAVGTLSGSSHAPGSVSVDFIGSRSDFPDAFAGSDFDGATAADRRDFDAQHEGYPRWRAGELLPVCEEKIGVAGVDDVPDLVLLHIGTNDVIRSSSGSRPRTAADVVRDVRRLLACLHSKNPDLHVVVAQIIPITRCVYEGRPNLGASLPCLHWAAWLGIAAGEVGCCLGMCGLCWCSRRASRGRART